MSTEQSIHQFVVEWNAEIEAKGMLLHGDPWMLPLLYEGSCLDIPETPESRQRIESLKQQIAELKCAKKDLVMSDVMEVAPMTKIASAPPMPSVPIQTDLPKN